jgi:hypothetical protein
MTESTSCWAGFVVVHDLVTVVLGRVVVVHDLVTVVLGRVAVVHDLATVVLGRGCRRA